ncbi:hypothetical protein VTL71DRAFT_14567 [Oculimacula yallundae]|uniref:Uncharacterized protein n=1 Tax=Oculimacula yallundae TaxID=86028 RepID=A0ABR4CIV1_9HELO
MRSDDDKDSRHVLEQGQAKHNDPPKQPDPSVMPCSAQLACFPIRTSRLVKQSQLRKQPTRFVEHIPVDQPSAAPAQTESDQNKSDQIRSNRNHPVKTSGRPLQSFQSRVKCNLTVITPTDDRRG